MLDQTDVAVSGSLALGVFENAEIDLFRKCLKPNLTIVDIGANIGYYTVIAGKNVGHGGQSICLRTGNQKPFFLKNNIEINKLTNVIPLKIGLSDKKE